MTGSSDSPYSSRCGLLPGPGCWSYTTTGLVSLPDGDAEHAAAVASAAKRVAGHRADLAHDVIADLFDWTGQRCLSDRTKAIAVDNRGLVKAKLA